MAKIKLLPAETNWIKAKWAKIRASQTKADEAGNEWTEMNALLNARYRDEDPVQKAKLKGANLALKDALDVGKWHSAEAQRHIDDVSLFLRLRELEIL
jgi:hypothetical protein